MASALAEVAPAFVGMAHRIVRAAVATVDAKGRPRSRVLHPCWEWGGEGLVGWVATSPTPAKRSHLDASPFASCNSWAPSQDACVAEARAAWRNDDATRERTRELFKTAPEPVGYDPAIIPPWKDGPHSEASAVLRLDPRFLRVTAGSVMLGQGGAIRTWTAPPA